MRNPNCQYDWYRSMFEGPPRTTDAFVREMEGKVRSQRRALAQRRGEDAYQAQVVATGQAKRCPLCTTAQSFEEKEKGLGRCKECGVDYEAPASFVTQFLISKPPKPRD